MAYLVYPVYPTAAQKDKLLTIAKASCHIFNQALITRRSAWLEKQQRVPLDVTVAMIPQWLAAAPWLHIGEIHPPQLRYACEHVDNIFKRYFDKGGRLPPTRKEYHPTYKYRLGDELHVVGIGVLRMDEVPTIHNRVVGFTVKPGWFAQWTVMGDVPEEVEDDGLIECQRCEQRLDKEEFGYNVLFDRFDVLCKECTRKALDKSGKL